MIKTLLNLLFPKPCSGCGTTLLESEHLVCTHCRHDMPFTQHHLDNNNETAKKFRGRLPVEHASSVVYFHKEGIVQGLIHNLKYRGKEEIGSMIGEWYVHDLKEIEALKDVTEIVPVPLHRKRLRQRGYNQVEGFGKALAEGLGKTYNDDILLRTQYTKTQTKKNLAARAEIINESFDVSPTDSDKGKHFLLVDDVITTGATLEACGKALLKIPGAKVSIITMAYAHS
ncbi:MAG: amidophosphoribosyltransferase [Flavobacterium psychrophilum]|nr:MAG: amidophosphoribosyltransferase [Flavobacterium psychrophilum]